MAKILVVEDDHFLSSAYKLKLSKAGFEVFLAGDGKEALETLQKEKVDLILLDLVMPRMDGFETLKELKKDTTLANIPVVVTSNLGQKENLDKAKQMGATDYMIKSDLSMESFVQKINEILK